GLGRNCCRRLEHCPLFQPTVRKNSPPQPEAKERFALAPRRVLGPLARAQGCPGDVRGCRTFDLNQCVCLGSSLEITQLDEWVIAMGFFFVPPTAADPAKPAAVPLEAAGEKIFREVRMQKPTLLHAKLELHARIIDEFNLVALDKLSREELLNELRSYVATYARTAKLALNQKELQAFTEEVVDEMKGFGPIEPLL